ncbi:hypothetical protein CSUI_005801, partial [Cystoisospora suis]
SSSSSNGGCVNPKKNDDASTTSGGRKSFLSTPQHHAGGITRTSQLGVPFGSPGLAAPPELPEDNCCSPSNGGRIQQGGEGEENVSSLSASSSSKATGKGGVDQGSQPSHPSTITTTTTQTTPGYCLSDATTPGGGGGASASSPITRLNGLSAGGAPTTTISEGRREGSAYQQQPQQKGSDGVVSSSVIGDPSFLAMCASGVIKDSRKPKRQHHRRYQDPSQRSDTPGATGGGGAGGGITSSPAAPPSSGLPQEGLLLPLQQGGKKGDHSHYDKRTPSHERPGHKTEPPQGLYDKNRTKAPKRYSSSSSGGNSVRIPPLPPIPPSHLSQEEGAETGGRTGGFRSRRSAPSVASSSSASSSPLRKRFFVSSSSGSSCSPTKGRSSPPSSPLRLCAEALLQPREAPPPPASSHVSSSPPSSARRTTKRLWRFRRRSHSRDSSSRAPIGETGRRDSLREEGSSSSSPPLPSDRMSTITTATPFDPSEETPTGGHPYYQHLAIERSSAKAGEQQEHAIYRHCEEEKEEERYEREREMLQEERERKEDRRLRACCCRPSRLGSKSSQNGGEARWREEEEAQDEQLNRRSSGTSGFDSSSPRPFEERIATDAFHSPCGQAGEGGVAERSTRDDDRGGREGRVGDQGDDRHEKTPPLFSVEGGYSTSVGLQGGGGDEAFLNERLRDCKVTLGERSSPGVTGPLPSYEEESHRLRQEANPLGRGFTCPFPPGGSSVGCHLRGGLNPSSIPKEEREDRNKSSQATAGDSACSSSSTPPPGGEETRSSIETPSYALPPRRYRSSLSGGGERGQRAAMNRPSPLHWHHRYFVASTFSPSLARRGDKGGDPRHQTLTSSILTSAPPMGGEATMLKDRRQSSMLSERSRIDTFSVPQQPSPRVDLDDEDVHHTIPTSATPSSSAPNKSRWGRIKRRSEDVGKGTGCRLLDQDTQEYRDFQLEGGEDRSRHSSTASRHAAGVFSWTHSSSLP